MRRVSLAGLALVGALLLAIPSAFAKSDVVAADPGITASSIKIGGTFPLTGPASSYAPIPQSMKAYFSYINARRGPDGKRGVYGRQIIFNYYDDGYNPVNSVQLQRKLVQEDKVFAVVGTLGTEVNQAVQPFLNSSKVPHVLVSTGASEFGKDYKKYPWTIGWQPDYVAEGRLYGTDIKNNKPNAKIAILYQNDSYGKDYINGFKSALGTAKVKSQIVAEQAYDLVGGTTPASQLARLKASGANTLMIFVTPTPTVQSYAILRAIAWKPADIYVNSVSATDTFMGAAVRSSSADIVNGSVSAQYLKDPASPTFANDATVKQYNTLMAKYNPRGRRHRRSQLLRLRQGGHVRPGDVQGREEPDAGRPDAGAALAQRDVAVPASGLEAEDVHDGPLHHLAPAADAVQQRLLGAGRPARRRAASRLSTTRQYERIVGAGDGPHGTCSWTSRSHPSRS